jgi:hypothetical protein
MTIGFNSTAAFHPRAWGFLWVILLVATSGQWRSGPDAIGARPFGSPPPRMEPRLMWSLLHADPGVRFRAD